MKKLETCPFCGSGPQPAHAVQCVACGAFLERLELPIGTTLAGGRYTIGKLLGQGGFGITYQGADTLLRRKVAIKELFPTGSVRHGTVLQPPALMGPLGFAHTKKRFIEEARTLAQFTHPGIVRVLDAFAANGTAYLIMDFLEGETLSKRIERLGRLPVAEVIRVAREVAAAINVVHNARLLHRDIKPDNLYLTTDGRTVLIDFGSARAFALDQTSRHTQLVTPGYAPLEQYTATARFAPYTDLYALGATLHHALTGKQPPAAPDRLQKETLEPLPAATPAGLKTAVLKAMAIRTEERPQSVADFLALLGEANPQPAPAPVPVRPNLPPAPAPTGGNCVVVATDGSGDHRSIEEALKVAPTGSVIHLRPGQHRVSRPVVFNRSLTLEGADADTTVLYMDCEGTLLHLSEGHHLQVRNLTLRVSGKYGDMVGCTRGVVEVAGCRISGAVAGDEYGGHGLAVWETGKAVVTDTVFQQCQVNGVVASGEAELTVERCTFRDNRVGLQVSGKANASVCNSAFIHNEGDGIAVNDTTNVALQSNTCRDNRDCGIALFSSGQTQALGNVCERNERAGIYGGGSTGARLTGNRCQQNKGSGMLLTDEARIVADQNICSENGAHGILVVGTARPQLTGNTCTKNKRCGIALTHKATGLIRANICDQNETMGLYAGEESAPQLEGNSCRQNKDCGIAFFDTAGGAATGNLCADNEHFGIFVNDGSKPALRANTFSGNKWGDVR